MKGGDQNGKNMIEEVLKHQIRANDFIFSREKLEAMDFETLSIICEASKHMVKNNYTTSNGGYIQ